jgi:uncharacterized membrane protein YhhN
MKKLLLQLFLLLGATNLAVEAGNFQWGIFLTKPLLLTTLSLWFYLSIKDRFDAFSRWMLAGFVFSIGGDTLLMFVEGGGEHFFLLGLGSFLAAHLCYISAFLKYPGWKDGRVNRKPLLLLPLLIFLVVFSWFLWNDLPAAFKVPVLVYSSVITGMATAAMNMGGRVSAKVARLLLAGALLFVLSDSLIALNKFKGEMLVIPQVRVLIMATYLAGQFLLAKGGVAAHEGAKVSS